MTAAELVVIGAGPAGASAALIAARAGRPVMLLERQTEPGDAICGGFLSWRTLAQLDRLGISGTDLQGHAVNGMSIFHRGKVLNRALPGSGMGLSRRRLDGLLLQTARDAGADARLGVMVQAITGRDIRLRGDAVIHGDCIMLATGKHDLRDLGRTVAASDPELGLRLRLPPSQSRTALIGDRIELHLFDRAYVGLILQEDGSANLCLAARTSLLAEAEGRPADLLARLADRSPALAERMTGWSPAMAVDAIARLPYGWRATRTAPGLYRLGDQAAAISSLAGEGMGIALASAASAVRHWIAHGAAGAPEWQAGFARQVRRPVATAETIKRLAAEQGWGNRIALQLMCLPGAAWGIAQLTRVPTFLTGA